MIVMKQLLRNEPLVICIIIYILYTHSPPLKKIKNKTESNESVMNINNRIKQKSLIP